MKTVFKKLSIIQSALKAPKSQYNSFGKYKYRNLEDILEAVKPLLVEAELTLTLSDEAICVGDRNYIRSTAVLTCIETGEQISTEAVAMEAKEQKGMQAAQISGACSSYCRKYLCNGLFLIDDTADADTQDNREQISPDPIDHTKVQAAYNGFKTVIDADVEVMDHKRVQEGWKRLTNDEQLAVSELFGKQKVDDGKGILYRSVIKNLLNVTEEIKYGI